MYYPFLDPCFNHLMMFTNSTRVGHDLATEQQHLILYIKDSKVIITVTVFLELSWNVSELKFPTRGEWKVNLWQVLKERSTVTKHI